MKKTLGQLYDILKSLYINNHVECVNNHWKCSKYSNGKRLSDWIKKAINFKYDTTRLKVKRVEKTYRANTNIRKAIVTVLISDRVGIREENNIRGKEGNFIIIKG